MVATILPPGMQQFSSGSGAPYAAGQVLMCVPGTLTKKTTWIDRDKSVINTNPIVLDVNGRCVIFGAGQYRQILRDVNGTTIWDKIVESRDDELVDLIGTGARTLEDIAAMTALLKATLSNGDQVIISGYATRGDGGGGIFFWDSASGLSPDGGTIFQADEAGAGRWRRIYAGEMKVEWFGAKGDEIVDDRAAIQAAIDSSRSGNGLAMLGDKTYLIDGVASADTIDNGLLLEYTSQEALTGRVGLIGQGKSSILKAGSTNMVVVRLSDGFCTLKDFSIDGDSLSGVWGLGILPESITQVTDLVYQQKNYIENIQIIDCEEAFPMQSGPAVGGAASGCWLNYIAGVDIIHCRRGYWLREPANGGVSSGVNRNKFFGGRVGQTGCNTGVQIDSGQGNQFIGVELEGIEDLVVPNATPTGFKVANADSWGHANESNSFGFANIESTDRHLEIANSRTQLPFLTFDASLCLFTANPLVSVGGYDASTVPQIIPGMLYQNGTFVAGWPLDTLNATAGRGSAAKYVRTMEASGLQDRNNYKSVSSLGDIASGGSANFTPFLAGVLDPVKSHIISGFLTVNGLDTTNTWPTTALYFVNMRISPGAPMTIGQWGFSEMFDARSGGVNNFTQPSATLLSISTMAIVAQNLQITIAAAATALNNALVTADLTITSF